MCHWLTGGCATCPGSHIGRLAVRGVQVYSTTIQMQASGAVQYCTYRYFSLVLLSQPTNLAWIGGTEQNQALKISVFLANSRLSTDNVN